jgi:hypothetical protein
MAQPSQDMLDSFRYMMEARKEIEDITGLSAVAVMTKKRMTTKYWEGNWEMRDCYNIENQMRELRRCGCDRCREQYDRLARERYYRDHPMYYIPQQLIFNEEKENPVENNEPKNYAVKLLVDQLKAQQGYLTSEKNKIESQKQAIKNANEFIKGYSKTKTGIEAKIKELSGALKKLGHKE